MKHSMAVKLLFAGVCALGTAALAQTDANPNPSNEQPSNAASPAEASPQNTEANPSGYGNDSSPSAAPTKNMTMSEKKQNLENIKKAIRDSETHRNRASGEQGTSAETGSMSTKPMGVQHLKVFRRGDKVVLRGTVRSQEEKDRVGSVAEGAANGEQIVNELKVK